MSDEEGKCVCDFCGEEVDEEDICSECGYCSVCCEAEGCCSDESEE